MDTRAAQADVCAFTFPLAASHMQADVCAFTFPLAASGPKQTGSSPWQRHQTHRTPCLGEMGEMGHGRQDKDLKRGLLKTVLGSIYVYAARPLPKLGKDA